MRRRSINLDELRERAKQALARVAQPVTARSADDGKPADERDHLLEELRVYQTELEIQNQELASAQGEVGVVLERYRTLYEGLPLPAVVIDGHGFVAEANRQGREFLGLASRTALQHRSIMLLFDADSRTRLQAVLRDRSTTAPRRLETLMVKSGDGLAPCDTYVTHLDPELTGEPRTLLMLVDRSAERALADSEARYQALFEQGPTPLFIYETSTRKISVANHQAWECYGYTPDEFRGLTLLDLWSAEERSAVAAMFEDSSTGAVSGEWRHCRRDGTMIDVAVSTSALAVGERGHRMMQVADITARRLAERQARELSLAVEQSAESIVIADRNGDIEYVNDAFLQVTGYARDEVIGRNPRVLQSGKTPPETYDQMWSALRAGRSWRGEFINRRKDGSEYTELAVISPLRQANGSISHYVAVKEDITERKALQKQLEARMAELEAARAGAEAANVAKSAFLANMSHEIRTPLNAILGVAQLLEQMCGDRPDQRELVAHIHSAGKVLLRSLNDVLDLAKVDAGELAIEREAFALTTVLDSVEHLMGPQARAKGVGLRVEPADYGSLRLLGDAVRLEQVLLNLVGNAIKFSDAGDVVIRIRGVARAGSALRLRFEVSDHGIGITAAKLATLFRPFTQADSSIVRRFGGTGLGLSISKRLVELMGGTIGAQSAQGLGSTFWFELPFEEHATTREDLGGGAPVQAEPVRPLADLRVLIVDDSRMNLDVLKRILERDGAIADTADNGQACLQALDASPDAFDLVLMDIQMPVMDGLTATRSLRQDPRFASMPVVALSAGVLPEERAAALAAGLDDFLAKPINLPELRLVLGKYLAAATAETN